MSSSVATVDIETKTTLLAGVDMVTPTGISLRVGVFAPKPARRINPGITQRLAAHGLAATISALTMCFAFVPTIGQFLIRKKDQSGAFATRANGMTLRDGIPGPIDC